MHKIDEMTSKNDETTIDIVSLATRISEYYENIKNLKTPFAPKVLKDIQTAISLLDNGKCRVAQYKDNQWKTNTWAKQAILLFFKTQNNEKIPSGFTNYFDKIECKFKNYSQEQFQQEKIRVVPNAIARFGSYIGPNCILMPSYINIGAYIDSGCMIDTWATVGSAAQIGKNVHISGGAGIGGVLEPLQATPTIIEDNCFIGARSEIVEGVIVEKNSVISMGVFISQSTPIYDRNTKKTIYGRVPAGSVVVPGSLPAKDGSHSLAAAIIVKTVDDKTRAKTSINEILRDI